VREPGFSYFSEELDAKRRAELLDEGLAILTGLWSGEPLLVGSFTRQFDEMEGHLWREHWGTTWAGFLKQACCSTLVKAFDPLTNMVLRQTYPFGCLNVGVALL